jgi:hypothetical protein
MEAVMDADRSPAFERRVAVLAPEHTWLYDEAEWQRDRLMHIAATALANAIPNAQHRTLEGQTHEVAAEAIAPVLVEFFNSNTAIR